MYRERTCSFRNDRDMVLRVVPHALSVDPYEPPTGTPRASAAPLVWLIITPPVFALLKRQPMPCSRRRGRPV